MATVCKVRNIEVMVELSAAEVREAIEHAAWCAVVKHDTSIAVQESPPRMLPDGRGGFRIYYVKTESVAA